MQERSQMFAVSYMLTLSDDVQAMGVGCITIVGGNLLKPLKPQFLKEIRRLEKQTDRGGRVESYIAWMPVPERSEA